MVIIWHCKEVDPQYSTSQFRCGGDGTLALSHWLTIWMLILKRAACQPKIRSWRQKEMFEYPGAAGGFFDRYGYPFCRGRIMGVGRRG